jgi:FkbM family methyltransferase
MTLSEQTYADDWHFYEAPETAVEQGDVVADCGAAEGLFSLLVAERASRVYAIEPLPLWNECMRETFANSANVEILPHALAAETGRARLQGSGFTAHLSADGEAEVSVETIDNLFFRRGIPLSYLKADLEGQDFAMLLGARETIRTFGPKIAITTYHRPHHAQAMIDYLKALNRQYRFRTTGIEATTGAPVMLHAWVDK